MKYDTKVDITAAYNPINLSSEKWTIILIIAAIIEELAIAFVFLCAEYTTPIKLTMMLKIFAIMSIGIKLYAALNLMLISIGNANGIHEIIPIDNDKNNPTMILNILL